MTRDWRKALLARTTDSPAVLVTVIATQGSTPRACGAWMVVDAKQSYGSIGGGKLECQEIARARRRLGMRPAPWHREAHRIVLGPDAGQCCGGVVEVLHEVVGDVERADLAEFSDAFAVSRPPAGGSPWQRADGPFRREPHPAGDHVVTPFKPLQPRVHIYGGGHVAAALLRVLDVLPFETRVHVDRATAADVTAPLSAMTAAAGLTDDLVASARAQPPDAIHLVVTHSHDLDYAICDALLRRNDFALLGLIGSATKRARFVQRLRRADHAEAAVARLVCPIGLDTVRGKDPAIIAVAVAAQLLALQSRVPA